MALHAPAGCPKPDCQPAASAFTLVCSSQQSDETGYCDVIHLQRCSSDSSVSSRQQSGPSPSRPNTDTLAVTKRRRQDGIAAAPGSDCKRQKRTSRNNSSAWHQAGATAAEPEVQHLSTYSDARAGLERHNNRQAVHLPAAPETSFLTSDEQLPQLPLSEDEDVQTPLAPRVSAALDADGASTEDCILQEMLSHLYEAEARSRPSITFLEDQHGSLVQPQLYLDAAMRTTAVGWLVEVAEEYQLHAESLFLAVALLDRYLSATTGVARTSLQLTSVACMLVAAKHEEECTPSVAEFAHIADDSFQVSDLLFMERQVLDVLSFRINTPTQYTFWSVFCHISPLPQPVAALASYLIELTLLDYEFLHYAPSEVAAAAILLALGHQEATAHEQGLLRPAAVEFQSLASKSGYRATELAPCARDLCILHARAAAVSDAISPFVATKEKYAAARWHHASLVPPRGWLPAHICAPAAFC